MPGYEIIEKKNLKTFNLNGIKPYDIKIGFLDFLREVRNYSREIERYSSFLVFGIEEVLFMSDDRIAISKEIHKILQSGASDFQRKMIQVQIACKDELTKGEMLYLIYRKEKLTLDYIFGSTSTHDVNGIKIYTTGFNLSS
ncbi:hypothetical protein MCHI_003702 [Candidatus Magnetoovum chiemensis]|nr:hypothetical protein MCHI_003702 [Candidatus Magnetoovum chiemensis]